MIMYTHLSKILKYYIIAVICAQKTEIIIKSLKFVLLYVYVYYKIPHSIHDYGTC